MGRFIYQKVQNKILRNFNEECWYPRPFQKKLFEKNIFFKRTFLVLGVFPKIKCNLYEPILKNQ